MAAMFVLHPACLSYVGLHSQERHYEGLMAQQIVADTIELLKEAGKLPAGYGGGPRNHLPRPAMLYGREAALQDVLRLLAQHRQMCVVAGPGEGKSVLAAEAAHRLFADGQLADGAYRIDLADAPTGQRAGAWRSLCCLS